MLASDEPGTRLVIPAGPPGVYLAMPANELLAHRKSIKTFNFFDDRPNRPVDPKVKEGIVFEEFKNTQFRDVVYFIQDEKLLGIAAFADYQGKIPAAVRQKFLSDVVKAYGQPDGAVVVSEARGGVQYNTPTLLWHLPTANIGVGMTPDKINSHAPKKSLLQIKMFSPELHTENKVPFKELPYDFPKLTEQQRKAILEPLQAAVKKIH